MAFETSFAEDSIMFLDLKAFLQISSSGCDDIDGCGITPLLNVVMNLDNTLKTCLKARRAANARSVSGTLCSLRKRKQEE